MKTITNANHEMEATPENNDAKMDEKQRDMLGKMQMVMGEEPSIDKDHFISTQELGVNSDEWKNSVHLLKADVDNVKKFQSMLAEKIRNIVWLGEVPSIDEDSFISTQELEVESEEWKNSVHLWKADVEDVKKFQSVLAEKLRNIEWMVGRIYNSLEDKQVVNSCRQTVSTATQTYLNISDSSTISSKLAQAAVKICKLEDLLYEKRKFVTKLKNKMTHYRLRKERKSRANLKEKSNARGQRETEVGLNDAPITNHQIEVHPGFNNQDMKQCVLQALLKTKTDWTNQEHPQLQNEQESMDSNCTAEANSTENTGASKQIKSPAQKQTAKTTTLLPVPKNESKECVIAKDKLCKEVSRILDKLTRDSFSDSLSEILELSIDATNIMAIVYLVHEKVTNINDSSQVLANLCEEIRSNLPKKTSAKMTAILMERCQSTFQSAHTHSDSREETNPENEMWVTNSDDTLKPEKCINSIRFMGELWSAGITADAIDKFIIKLLNNADDLSMECFCAFLKAAGSKFEESNDNVSKYFSKLKDICKSSNDLSTRMKQNLRDLIQFRREKRMQVKHHPKTGLNNQEHPQLQDEQKSLDSNCTAKANSTVNTSASTQGKSKERKKGKGKGKNRK
jgi:hypothetical protein